MAENFYVVDGENNTVWVGKENDDHPEQFTTFKAAEKRAKEVAESSPGDEIKIVKTVAIVTCEVQAPLTRHTE
jgi:hypothetical protein